MRNLLVRCRSLLDMNSNDWLLFDGWLVLINNQLLIIYSKTDDYKLHGDIYKIQS